MRRSQAFLFVVLTVSPALGAVPPAAGGGPSPRFDDPTLPARAHAVSAGGTLRVSEVPLFEGEEGSVLELRRFRVFRGDARVVIHGAGGPRTEPAPPRADFQGVVVVRARRHNGVDCDRAVESPSTGVPAARCALTQCTTGSANPSSKNHS